MEVRAVDATIGRSHPRIAIQGQTRRTNADGRIVILPGEGMVSVQAARVRMEATETEGVRGEMGIGTREVLEKQRIHIEDTTQVLAILGGIQDRQEIRDQLFLCRR